jgi:hypothetical protein
MTKTSLSRSELAVPTKHRHESGTNGTVLQWSRVRRMKDKMADWINQLQREPTNPTVQEYHLGQLLVSGVRGYLKPGQLNGTGLHVLVLAAMENHPDHPAVLFRAIGLLAQLTDHCSDFRGVLETALSQVFTVMQNHESHPELMHAALFALTELIHVNKGDHGTLLLNHIHDIVRVIQARPDIVPVALYGCIVLDRVLGTIQSLQDEQETNQLTCTKVLACLGTVIRLHSVQSDAVFQTALAVIGNLAQNPNFLYCAMDPAAKSQQALLIARVLSAVDTHNTNVDFVAKACSVLTNLTYYNDYAQAILVYLADDLTLILDLMMKYENNEKVMKNSCLLCGNLLLASGGQLDLGASGTTLVTWLLEMLQTHVANPLVLAPVCFVIRNLATLYAPSHMLFRQRGGLEKLKSVLTVSPNGVMGWPCHAFRAVAALQTSPP